MKTKSFQLGVRYLVRIGTTIAVIATVCQSAMRNKVSTFSTTAVMAIDGSRMTERTTILVSKMPRRQWLTEHQQNFSPIRQGQKSWWIKAVMVRVAVATRCVS